MPNVVESTDLILPEPQLYIAVALLMAIAAMTASDVRDSERLLPKVGVNIMTVILFLGSLIAMCHIILTIVSLNQFNTMTGSAQLGLLAHGMVLLLLFIAVSIWYRVVVVHEEKLSKNYLNPVDDS